MSYYNNNPRTKQIVEMRKTMSAAEIASSLGVSRQIIYYHLNKDAHRRAKDELMASESAVDNPILQE
jgi:hypothetical protein